MENTEYPVEKQSAWEELRLVEQLWSDINNDCDSLSTSCFGPEEEIEDIFINDTVSKFFKKILQDIDYWYQEVEWFYETHSNIENDIRSMLTRVDSYLLYLDTLIKVKAWSLITKKQVFEKIDAKIKKQLEWQEIETIEM